MDDKKRSLTVLAALSVLTLSLNACIVNRFQVGSVRTDSETVALAESPEVQEILGMSSQAQAAMFIHYEVRYAFLDHLLRSETIQTPIDFENGDRNGPDDIGSLVFLIR